MKNKVAITKCTKYDYEEIKKSLYTLIENSDFPLVKGKKVLVKPNILSDSKEEKNITVHGYSTVSFVETHQVYQGQSLEVKAVESGK